MTRKPLFLLIPVVAVIAALVLFFQRDNTGRPSAPTSNSGLPTGSGANMPPNAGVDAPRSGTPQPVDAQRTPTSATPTSPSGEPAQRR